MRAAERPLSGNAFAAASKRRLLDEVLRRLFVREERLHFPPQLGVAGAGLRQECGPWSAIQVERRLTDLLDPRRGAQAVVAFRH